MEYLILPISVVLLSLFLIATLIRESLVKNELLKFRLSVAVIIAFSIIAITSFYDHFEHNVLIYICAVYIVVIGLLMFNSLFLSIKEKKIRDIYFECIENNNYFVYLDRKNRIKNVSKSFAYFFGLNKTNIVGNKFSDLLSQRYSNLIVNDNEYNSDNISNIFSNISTAKEDLKFEIKCLDVRGKEIFLHLKDKPIYNSNGKFIAHIIYGASKGLAEIDKRDEVLSEKSIALEMNKLRFRALLEEGNDPLFFLNIASNSIWANDALVSKLGFSGNSISFEEYKRRVYPDDLAYYLSTLEGLSISHPTYEIKYRFRNGYDYIYVHEKGKKVFGPETEIISVVEKIKSSYYEKTDMLILDELKTEDDLYNILDSFDDSVIYELVCLHLDNVKEINEEYGRRTGNIAMNDYIKAISEAFVDDKLIFRTGGLEFYFVIKDFKKMEKLKRNLEMGQVLNASATYGSNKITINSSMGIINNHKFKDPKMLVKYAKISQDLTKGKAKKYNFYE